MDRQPGEVFHAREALFGDVRYDASINDECCAAVVPDVYAKDIHCG
jgi:hypothetical protein